MIKHQINRRMQNDIKSMTCLFLIFIVGLTVFFAIAFFIDMQQELKSVDQLALIEGKASYNKDLLYRRWASIHGGVYVPITDVTLPNPALSHIPDRDVITENGVRLTLVNPAYMTRQVHEIAESQFGVKGHITSLNPIRPENGPDEWEAKVLKLFETGESEDSTVESIDGIKYFRYMHAMTVEDSCLKCHAIQGYKVGDIRGGISVSVPMDVYDQIAVSNIKIQITIYSLVSAAVILLSASGFKRLKMEIISRQLQQKKTIESEALLAWSQGLGHIGSWNLDVKTNNLVWSDEVFRIFGCVPQEFAPTYEAFLNFTHPDDRAAVDEAYSRSVIENSDGYEIEHRILRQGTAEIRHLHERCVHVWDSDGTIIQSIGMVQDITERKLAENEQNLLLEKAERLSRESLAALEDQRRSKEQLLIRMEELKRFHNVTIDRELVMVDLKKEVNALLSKSGRDEKYHIVE